MKFAAIGLCVLALAIAAFVTYVSVIANPRIARELHDNPQGETAKKVMLIRLPSGKELPINYLREGERVYAGADGRWWKELRGAGEEVEILIRGETLRGTARAVEDDPDYTREVFERLRPTSYSYLGGTLVEIRLQGR